MVLLKVNVQVHGCENIVTLIYYCTIVILPHTYLNEYELQASLHLTATSVRNIDF